MPPRGPIESSLGLLSLLIWGPALAINLLVLSWLPRWRPGMPDEGCVFADSLMVFVRCHGTLADGLFGGLLTWSYYWTTGIGWMAAFMPPLLLPWILSIQAAAPLWIA